MSFYPEEPTPKAIIGVPDLWLIDEWNIKIVGNAKNQQKEIRRDAESLKFL